MQKKAEVRHISNNEKSGPCRKKTSFSDLLSYLWVN